MNYLTGAETQANVPTLWVAARWLQHVKSCSFAELAAAVRPTAVVTGADNALRASLSVGGHIGIVQAPEMAGPWSPGARLLPDSTSDHRLFRQAVREALLSQAVADLQAGLVPSDVAVGFAWLCSLDPTRPLPWGWNETELIVRAARLDQVIKNSEQWRPFRRWAVSLGMAVANGPPGGGVQVLVPDPTTAVFETLSRLPVRSVAPAFLAGLAEYLPTIDGGALEGVAGVAYAARGEATIGPSLAHALKRLDRRGVLLLEKADDGSHRVSYRTAAGIDTFDDVEIRLRGT
jgi:hypothetical protein